MKINVVGKAYLKGIAKKSQDPCDAIQIHYLGFACSVEDKAALTPSLDPTQYPYDRITVPGDYVVDFDNRGFPMDFRPTPASEAIWPSLKEGQRHEKRCPPLGYKRSLTSSCHTCRTRHWRMLYRTNLPPHDNGKPHREKARRGKGTASITPL